MSTADAPVAPSARHDGLDVLRGVAVLMIFAVNVRAVLWPLTAQADPALFEGPYDLRIDLALQYLIDGKWIAVFAVLFGAGLCLIADKAVAAGSDPARRIVRRQLWLLAFGLGHLFLVWLGDVLVTYALVGLVALGFVRRPVRCLLAWAAGLLLASALVFGLLGWALSLAPSDDPLGLAPMVAAELEAKRGDYLDVLAWRAGMGPQRVLNSLVLGPSVLSYMLTGMALFRSGFLLSRWPVCRTLALSVPLLALAWSVDAWRTGAMGAWRPGGGGGDHAVQVFRYLGASLAEGLAGGVGYAGLIAALVRAGVAPRPLAAAGRMAFTNYVVCSVIGTTLAYGYGYGLIGRLTLAQAMIVVAVTWLGVLAWSPLWLSAFRHGPLEWAWRSLTYGAPQPLRREGAEPVQSPKLSR